MTSTSTVLKTLGYESLPRRLQLDIAKIVRKFGWESRQVAEMHKVIARDIRAGWTVGSQKFEKNS